MNEELKTKLTNDISGMLDALDKLDSGSKEESELAESIVKLCKIAQDEEKQADEKARIELDKEKLAFEKDKAKMEAQQAKKKQQQEKFLFWAGKGAEAGICVLGWLFFTYNQNQGLRFEETGSIGSTFVRGLLTKMPLKK